MKRFVIVALASFICICMIAPALGDVKVGGRLVFDTYLQKRNDAYTTSTDWKQLEMEANTTTNLNARWTEGDFGLYFELGMGANNEQTALSYNHYGSDPKAVVLPGVFVRKTYGWWEFSPGMKLTLGQDTTGFSPLVPMQACGTGSDQFKVIGVGFGNIYSGRVYQVRGNFKLGETGGLGIAFVDPRGGSLLQGTHWNADGTTPNFNGNLVSPAGSEETTMPRIDLSADFTLGPLRIYPGVLYQKQTWDDVAAGADDEITTSLYSLGVKTAFGSLGLAAEINGGQNPGNANLLTTGTYVKYGPGGAGPGIDMAAIVDADGKVRDTDFMGYWIDASYKFGKHTFHAIYGQQHVENDMGTAAGVDNPGRENTRTIVTFNVWIPVSKYIIIVPEVDFWDYGDKEEEGQDDVDLGKASIYGINWLMVF
jgi:hypothetical protein